VNLVRSHWLALMVAISPESTINSSLLTAATNPRLLFKIQYLFKPGSHTKCVYIWYTAYYHFCIQINWININSPSHACVRFAYFDARLRLDCLFNHGYVLVRHRYCLIHSYHKK
jgi:hypothetical protein